MTKRAESIVTTIAALPPDSSLWTLDQQQTWKSAHKKAEPLARQIQHRDDEAQKAAVRKAERAAEMKAAAPERRQSRLPTAGEPPVDHEHARRQRRTFVVLERRRLNRTCEGPERGLPGDCGTIPDRPGVEVHEIVGRGRSGSTSQYVLGLTATLCPVHHDYCTSAVGATLRLVEGAGLIVPSSALLPSVKDHALGLRLPRGLRPEWSWARPDGPFVGVAS